MPVVIFAERSFDNTREYEIGSEDPSIVGLAAPVGSRALNYVDGFLWIKIGLGDFDWADASAGQEKELFIRYDHNGSIGDYTFVGVGSNSNIHLSFSFPAAMEELIAVEIIVMPNSIGLNKSIDISSSYGLVGENILTHQETASLTGLNFTADTHDIIDVTSVFSSVVSGDIAGITTDHQAIGQTLRYLGLRLRYK
jgi:hypothetical protein